MSEREWLEGNDDRTQAERQAEFMTTDDERHGGDLMSTHPFDIVETISPTEDDPEPRKGNRAYYDWLEATITAAIRKPVPWTAVELAITLDRAIREHEAERDGGPMCAECTARASGSSAPVQGDV